MKTKILFKIFAGIICLLPGLALLKAQTVTDIDGNVYKTVTIGTQTWMAENLKTTHYNDGTPILLVTNDTVWRNTMYRKLPAYCWYNNNESVYKKIYGALYNFFAVDTKRLCPTGWHVPSDADWKIMVSNLGDSNTGGKLKEADTIHWDAPNNGATNETGFTALPGGSRNKDGNFNDINYKGIWWTSDGGIGKPGPVGISYILTNIFDYVSYSLYGARFGLSVRCVCNQITSGINNEYSEKVVIYPNPANDKLYFKNNNYNNTLIMIFDLQGKQVFIKQIDSESIDISNLSKGIYVVKLVCPESIMITKFIKK